MASQFDNIARHCSSVQMVVFQIKEGWVCFAAMAGTYFLGVFNDNFFKQAALLLAITVGMGHLQSVATMLFSLPFIPFSAYAGWFADRFSKEWVVISSKILELCAMLIGAYGILALNWNCVLAMVFIMSTQSTLFGPALNGSIPELFPREYVPPANAILKLVATLAILAGIAMSGIAHFKLRPLADENQVNLPGLVAIMKMIRVVTMPEMTLCGDGVKQRVLQAIAEVVAGLKQGEQFLFYPSGRVYRSQHESLRGNSGVSQIVEEMPNVRIILVRTTGLWGSTFSRASESKPRLFKDLGFKIWTIVSGFIFLCQSVRMPC